MIEAYYYISLYKITIKICFAARNAPSKLMPPLPLFFLLINWLNKEPMLYRIMLKNISRRCKPRNINIRDIFNRVVFVRGNATRRIGRVWATKETERGEVSKVSKIFKTTQCR